MPIHHTSRVALALLSLLAIGLPSAQAEAPLALTISGGGTKGAYMGGHLYYMAQANRLDGRFTPLVFTGASAGAINALIGALSACGPAELNPRKSLYWEAWTSIGFRELLSVKTMTGSGIFTIDAYTPALATARQLWDAGLPGGCDLIIGLAVTRAQPRTVRLTAEFPALPLSREVVLLRLTGRGVGQPPQLRNYVDPDRPVGQLLLPLQGPDAQPFESLASVVLASAAFPVGFSPISIAHCLSDANAPCTPATATAADFIDGGAFDNQPLGVLDGVGDAAICEDPALTDFSILLQVTLDQFNDDCRRLAIAGRTPPKTGHAHCAAAMQGEPPPQVPGVALLSLAERRRRPNEGVLRYQIRLLSRYGLHFQDLGLERDESAQAYNQIIRLAARALQRFADVQPRSS